MSDAVTSRRDFIRWIVSSMALAPIASAAIPAPARQWTAAPLSEQCTLLFGDHMPAGATELVSRAASGVYAAVYESVVKETEHVSVVERWLCIASEFEPGRFAVQTTKDAVTESTSYHPVELELKILESGSVELFEQGTRWNSTHRWSQQDGRWQLAASNTVGASAGEIFQEEYDQLRQEVVISRGKIDDDWPLASTRHLTSETFALTGYTRGPLA